MRAVVQRVSAATLNVADQGIAREHASIGPGLVVFAGVERRDAAPDADWMASKIVHLRIFNDDEGKMNRSVLDVQGEVLLVSNFTVAGEARKGRRPSFDNAMRPPEAEAAFDGLVERVRELGTTVQTGVFGAHMHVHLVNDGPVTLWLDSAGIS